jgi:hypothetical protein
MYGGHVRNVGTALWHARQARESINRAGRDVKESNSWLREEQYTAIKRALNEARETLLHVCELLKQGKEARRESEDVAPADHGFTDPWQPYDYHELYPIHETAHEVVRPSKAPKLSIRPSQAN